MQHFIEVEGGVAHADGTYTDPAVAYGGTWEWTFQEVKSKAPPAVGAQRPPTTP